MYANVVHNANCSKIHGGLLWKKKHHEICQICPEFGPHISVCNVGAVETETRKAHMTLNNTTFFVFGNCGLLNFPWEWYIQHISTWNSKANQFFFHGCFSWMMNQIFINKNGWNSPLPSIKKWFFKVPGIYLPYIYHIFTMFKSTIHASVQKNI